MPFTTPGAAGQEVPLSSTYHRINLANRDQYVQSALDYRLHEFDFQVSVCRMTYRTGCLFCILLNCEIILQNNRPTMSNCREIFDLCPTAFEKRKQTSSAKL